MLYIYENRTDKVITIILHSKDNLTATQHIFEPHDHMDLDYPGLDKYVPPLFKIVLNKFASIPKPIVEKISVADIILEQEEITDNPTEPITPEPEPEPITTVEPVTDQKTVKRVKKSK